jgi:hypothetical protein
MKGCHICEVPDPKTLDDYKARITFIAALQKGSSMENHVVGHVREGLKRKPPQAHQAALEQERSDSG